jgi:hypothetical protein
MSYMLSNEELQLKIEQQESLIKELSSRLENWDKEQLKYPLDPNTQKMIFDYSSSSTVTAASIGLGDVNNTSDATKNSAVAVLENKTIKRRVGTTSSASSLTIAADSYDAYRITALAANLTINSPSGTVYDGQPLLISIKDNGTARTITWNSVFRVVGTTLPTTTVINKYNVIGCVWNNGDSKWDVLMALQES